MILNGGHHVNHDRPILQTKKHTTNVCPMEPENSRVQKQNLWSLLYLALIFTLKKKKDQSMEQNQ